jgi:hypothetical protein
MYDDLLLKNKKVNFNGRRTNDVGQIEVITNCYG